MFSSNYDLAGSTFIKFYIVVQIAPRRMLGMSYYSEIDVIIYLNDFLSLRIAILHAHHMYFLKFKSNLKNVILF